MSAPPVSLSFASVFAADFSRLAEFYQQVFDLPEVESLRSEHFRGLRIGPTVLGFSRADTAYDLLDLPRPSPGSDGVRSFVTFEVAAEADVEAMLVTAVAAGATAVQVPHRTYYGAWQAVALDPEGNAFRINHLPELHAT